jgi:hypothetical protein
MTIRQFLRRVRQAIARRASAVRIRTSRPWSPTTIAQYDAAERTGLAALSVPEVMAYTPVAFQRVGYPVRVQIEAELLRYADHNYESEVRRLFEPGVEFRPAGYVNCFTADEAKLINRLRDRVVEMTRQRFGRPVRPISNLLVQIGPFRMMNAIAKLSGKERLSVFEVGPGLGYLGALLIMMGHRYASYDITQSLCLWQNRLHGYLAGDEFGDLIRDADPGLYASRRVVQVPWWKYIFFRHGPPIKADIVYSNSNLGEMTTVSLQHMLHISKMMLAESDIGLLLFMSPGSPAQNDEEFVMNQIKGFGFRRVFSRYFDGFILEGRALPPVLQRLEEERLPHYNPSGGAADLMASDVMALSPEEAPLDATIAQFLNGWQPPFRT